MIRIQRASSSFKGTSLPENFLVIGLLTLMAAVFLTVFGGNLTDQYNNMTAAFGGSPGHDGTIQDEAERQDGKNPVEAKALSDNATPQAGRKDVSVTLADGTVLNLAGYPADMATSVETIGIDGTSRQYASSLQALAEQLKAHGKLDDTQYKALIDLSKTGFSMADKQQKVAAALAASGGDDAKYIDNLGKAGLIAIKTGSRQDANPHQVLVVSLYNCARQLSFPEALYTANVNSYQKYSGEEKINKLKKEADTLVDFQKIEFQLEIAKTTQAMQDPVVNRIVTAATRDLMYLANASANSYQPQEIVKNVRESRGDATVICKSGNGSAQSGIDCQ